MSRPVITLMNNAKTSSTRVYVVLADFLIDGRIHSRPICALTTKRAALREVPRTREACASPELKSVWIDAVTLYHD